VTAPDAVLDREIDDLLLHVRGLVLVRELLARRGATPVNWKQGDDVIIAGSVSDDEAKETYPEGWQSPRPYIRIVPQPR